MRIPIEQIDSRIKDLVERLKRNKWSIILSIIHIILSFYWENTIFTNTGFIVEAKFPCDEKDSELFVKTAHMVACFIILFGWLSIKRIWSNKKNKRMCRLFISLSFLFICFAFLTYPKMYGWEVDDLAIYELVTHKQVLFWHSYLTNLIYLASYFIFPHPISLPIIQVICWCGVCSYIILNIFILTENKWLRTLGWSFVVLYETYSIALMPYRNCMYTILSLFFIAYLALNYMKNEKFSYKNIIILSIFGGILAFWRSEGCLYLLFTFFILVIGYGKKYIKQSIICTILMMISFFIVSFPQKIANEKYYRKDYMIINMVSALSPILNNQNCNIDYYGAIEDLENINNVIDITYIKQFGSMGYQYYNASQGRNLTQTNTSDVIQTRFIKSSIRLIGHNIGIFIRDRIRNFFSAIGVVWPDYVSIYQITGNEHNVTGTLDSYFTMVYRAGEHIESTVLLKNSTLFKNIQTIFEKIVQYYTSIMTPVSIAMRIILLCGMFYLVFYSLFKKEFFFFTCFLSNLGMLAGIVIFAPEARTYYY